MDTLSISSPAARIMQKLETEFTQKFDAACELCAGDVLRYTQLRAWLDTSGVALKEHQPQKDDYNSKMDRVRELRSANVSPDEIRQAEEATRVEYIPHLRARIEALDKGVRDYSSMTSSNR